MIDDIIVQLDEGLEGFLARWSEHLQQAGYFELTFATRDDSIKAFYALLAALKELDSTGTLPSLKDLRESNCIDTTFFL